MTSVEQIVDAILALPKEDYRRIASWLSDRENQLWDEQIERDVAAGRLDRLAAEALEEYHVGRTREI